MLKEILHDVLHLEKIQRIIQNKSAGPWTNNLNPYVLKTNNTSFHRTLASKPRLGQPRTYQ